MNDKHTLTPIAGHYYKTRKGLKAFVGYKSEEDKNFPFIGHIIGLEIAETWDADGKARREGRNDNDLVAEWVKPKRIKGWLAICSADHGQIIYPGRQIHPTAAIAFEANPNAIACIEIDVLEGAGLEGEVA